MASKKAAIFPKAVFYQCVLAGCFFLLVSGRSMAQDELNFEKDVKRILAENCFACHGQDPETRAADLRLDQRDAAIDFGAIEPGDAQASSIIERIYHEDPEQIMPPPETNKNLTAKQKETLKRWIEQGAPYTKHWSLIAPEKTPVPEVKNKAWPKTEIDRFVLSRLEREGLDPAAETDARTLLRRLSLDTVGLPPSPKELAQFEAEFAAQGDEAVSKWIDKLMARPAWGEHRARYWLDAARYADTHGMHFDNYREMWPYRDWVIKAFNRNQPFDQFTIEQLAGDLLDNPSDQQLIATGFQRCNMTTNEGGTIDDENRAIYAADRVQTFGWVYLGLTTNCCQCHDHKFDPLTIKDYYALAAFFRNTTEPAKDGNVKSGKSAVLKVLSDSQRKRLAEIEDELKKTADARKEYESSSDKKFLDWLKSVSSTEGTNREDQEPVKEGLSTKSDVEPIFQLPLNEGKGNIVTAAIGFDRPVIAKDCFRWNSDGKFGPAIVLEKNKTVNAGEIRDFKLEDPFSFGAWTKALEKYGGAAIIAKMDVSKKHRGWDLYHQSGRIAVHLVDSWPGNALKVRTRNVVVKENQWQHIFATYDGSRKPEGIRIFVDGELQETETEKNTIKKKAVLKTKTPLRVGQRSSEALYAEGQVQDVRIFDKQLSAEQVKAVVESNGDYFKKLVAIPANQRTKAQVNALKHHYLAVEDDVWPGLVTTATVLEREKNDIRRSAPITLIQEEKPDSMAKTNVLMRGAYDKLGEEVIANTPKVLHPMQDDAPKNRLGLAKWVVDPANPLTARVTVNRFWQEIFGQGIVATSEDFGVMGTPPSNQDLLDWLAVDFRESGWDVKRLYKKILMSATYRQSCKVTPEKIVKDEDNSLLSRGPRFRLDAEVLRDYALASSGLLNDRMYGRGVKPYQPDHLWDVVGLPKGDTRKYVQDKGDMVYRRSLYSFWKRMSPPPNLEAFNAPNREVCTVRRERTNTPLQALVTLNDPQFFEAARVLAEKAIKAGADDWHRTLDFVAQRTVCRSFVEREIEIIKSDFDSFITFYRDNIEDARQLVTVGQSSTDKSVDVAQLAAWSMVCNQLLNLDEVLTK